MSPIHFQTKRLIKRNMYAKFYFSIDIWCLSYVKLKFWWCLYTTCLKMFKNYFFLISWRIISEYVFKILFSRSSRFYKDVLSKTISCLPKRPEDVFRSSHRKCSVKKDVLKTFANFTGKHLCWILFLIKLQANTNI